MSDFADFWQWLKDHDASNWFVIAFTVVLWPIVLSGFFYWWSNRKIQSIRDLQVLPTPAPPDQMTINGQTFDAVVFTFTNQTGSVVYLYRARLRERPKNFPIPLAASLAEVDLETSFSCLRGLPPQTAQLSLSFGQPSASPWYGCHRLRRFSSWNQHPPCLRTRSDSRAPVEHAPIRRGTGHTARGPLPLCPRSCRPRGLPVERASAHPFFNA
jgi:hypothetical protein